MSIFSYTEAKANKKNNQAADPVAVLSNVRTVLDWLNNEMIGLNTVRGTNEWLHFPLFSRVSGGLTNENPLYERK
jgi:hypothetical protein